jgi:hypothetical protein
VVFNCAREAAARASGTPSCVSLLRVTRVSCTSGFIRVPTNGICISTAYLKGDLDLSGRSENRLCCVGVSTLGAQNIACGCRRREDGSSGVHSSPVFIGDTAITQKFFLLKKYLPFSYLSVTHSLEEI